MHPSHPLCLRACRWAVTFALALPLTGPGPALAQARERTLYVSALDKATAAPVERLSPEDVRVREDGVAREVLRVTPATDPLQVAILVDNSVSSSRAIPDMRRGVRAFVEALGEGHELSLVTYAERPTLVASFTTARAEIERAVDRLYAPEGSGAYLLEALVETSRGFIKREAPRPVIVVLATEGVEFSNTSHWTVLEQLQASGAQLHLFVLATGSGLDRTEEERQRSIVFDRGSRESGGQRENLLTSMAFTDALGKLAAELTHQFKVVYAQPESLIPPKKVEVSSAKEDLEVRGGLAPVARPPRG